MNTTAPTLIPIILDPADPATALLLNAREAMAGRLDKMEAALVKAAEAIDEMADVCDRLRYADSALHYRRLARECREASR